ncbi:transmembrane protein 231 isoform X2 [Euwallacea fornicatus]|uniref:transmembrane protein 231 isoform X2 n=1 Tax=Euwallacea fornicatus TaxID=995702 RepID=UPI00338DD82B
MVLVVNLMDIATVLLAKFKYKQIIGSKNQWFSSQLFVIMAVLEVHTNVLKVKYKACLLSKATLITVICEIVAVALPFILCYQTGGFWLKQDFFYEQPNVKVKGEYLFWIITKDKTLFCSSFPSHDPKLDPCSSIKIFQSDQNYDGKIDTLELTIQAMLPAVTSYYFILSLKYSMKEKSPCVFRMNSALIHQQLAVAGLSHIIIQADLGLYQSVPLKCSGDGVFTNLIPDSMKDLSFEEIVTNYAASDMKTTLENLLLSIPEHKIYFKPGIWQILKFAWVQFLSLYLVTWWLISGIKDYIFKNNLVLLYKDKTCLNK